MKPYNFEQKLEEIIDGSIEPVGTSVQAFKHLFPLIVVDFILE